MKYQSFGSLAVGMLAFGLLSGCETFDSILNYLDSDHDTRCPNVEVLASASVLPAFDPKEGAEVAGVVYQVAMTGVDLDCSAEKKMNAARSYIKIRFRATRSTGGPKAIYRVPYFIADTINGRILDKKLYWQEFQFDAGQAIADSDVKVEDLSTVAARRRRPSDYHFIVGFQLTKAQLEYNKRTEQYGP
jgi:hypothetical protein